MKYNPVISTHSLEDSYFNALMAFFGIDSLFHDLFNSEYSVNSLNQLKIKLDDRFSDKNIRNFVDKEVDRIEVYHANQFNYQFPASETQFHKSTHYDTNLELLKINQYIYIKHYIEDLVFVLTSALTLTLVTGAGRDFLEQYLDGKKESFTNEIKGFAEDTTIKNVDNLTMVKSELMQYDGYTWQTMEDDKVRESHRALNGKHMQWDNPDPKEGHPGTSKNCRCIAIPKKRD